MNPFEVGAQVRAKSPDDFVEAVARKLRNRVGVIERFQQWSGNPIVRFPAVGRRKEFVWVAASHWLEAA